MDLSLRPAPCVLIAAALLAACSPSSSGGGPSTSAPPSGDRVGDAVVVDAPFDADERCYVADADDPTGVALIPGAVGCAGSGLEDNPLAAVGSRFTAESMVVTYRGGGYLRAPSDNPANPVRIQALAVFDVELPGADLAWFTSGGLREVSIFGHAVSQDATTRQLGACGVWPNASSRLIGAGQGFAAPIAPGQVVTVAYCGEIGAPAEVLAGEPYVSFQAAIGEGQTFANVALRDQDSDADAFADVAATIDTLAAAADVDADELGLSDLRSRFAALVGGEPVVTVERTGDGLSDEGFDDTGSRGPVDSEFDDDGQLLPLPDQPNLPAPRLEEENPDADEPDTPRDAGANELTGNPRGEPVADSSSSPEEAASAHLTTFSDPGAPYTPGCAATTGRCVQQVDSPFPSHTVVAYRTFQMSAGSVEGYLLIELYVGAYYVADNFAFNGLRERPDWLADRLSDQL